MNLSIDRSRLSDLLEKAPPCKPPPLAGYVGNISEYLIRHYFLPFLQDSQPTIGDLDFSQFTSDDVVDMRNYLDFISETEAKLIKMMFVFSDTAPLPLVGKRAFF